MSQAKEDLEELLTEIRKAWETTRDLVTARETADDAARETIKAVERALLTALGGESLRGLPDLGGRFHGLRVDADASTFARLPAGRACLALDVKGLLVVATKFPVTTFTQRAPSGLVRASTLVPYLDTVCRALRIHLASVQDRTATFGALAALAGRVATATTDL